MDFESFPTNILRSEAVSKIALVCFFVQEIMNGDN